MSSKESPLLGLAVSLTPSPGSRERSLWEAAEGKHTFCIPSWQGPTYSGGGVSVLVSDTLSWLGRSSSRMTWGFSFP